MSRGRRRQGPDLATRVASLRSALELGGDRLDPGAVGRARSVLDRVGARLALGPDKTVVALAGATGTGKSSLFNALAGMEIAPVAALRPTTATPSACVWGEDPADALLDWLSVPRRHRTTRESVLDAREQAGLRGLVLLDLPDHDSHQVSHRLEVDRLVELVDLLVWVVDPQKYADEVLHAQYLRRLRGHEQVMLVVLNQVDLLAPEAVQACRSDLQRLLRQDGLGSVRVMCSSARTGEGVPELRAVLGELVRAQAGASDRLAADLDTVTAELSRGVAGEEADPRSLPGSGELVSALAGAAGVPVVVQAVVADHQRRGAAATGWPFTRWVTQLRPDPLARLHLGGRREPQLVALTRSSVPAANPAQLARVELALRSVAQAACAGLPLRWQDAVQDALTPRAADLTDALDGAVSSVELDLRPGGWWPVARALQAVLAAAGLAGLVWLVLLGLAQWLMVGPAGVPALGPLPLPTLLVAVGLLGGLVLAAVFRWLVRLGARHRGDRAAAALGGAVAAIARSEVLDPVAQVLRDHRGVRESLSG